MKIAVLGSNSFSGQDLIDLLLDDPKYEIIGISRSPEKSGVFLGYRNRGNLQRFRFYRLDINKDMDGILALMDAERPDIVINFAAQSDVETSWEYPWQWYQTNAVALARLIAHLSDQAYLKRYIHISSPEIYGNCCDIDETANLNPSTPYAASKAAADLLLQVYMRQGFPSVIVRSTNVYGARQQIHKIIPRAIIYSRLRKKLELRGSGEAIKSYIHIRDVSRAERFLIEANDVSGVYHISPDRSISIRQLVRAIYDKLGVDFNDSVVIKPRHKGRDAAYIIKSDKMRSLGWKPEISLSDGLNEVIAWVDKYLVDDLAHRPLNYRHAA